MRYIFFAAIILILFSCKKSSDSNTLSIKADFFYSHQSTTDYPIKAKFTNNSTGATSYVWDFGKGITSIEASPVINFDYSGSVPVKLIARNGSAVDSITKVIEVPYKAMTVVVIYLIPKDYVFDKKLYSAIRLALPTIQDWYKNQLGGKTFNLNNPIVDTLISDHFSTDYLYSQNIFGMVKDEVWARLIKRAKNFDQIILTFLPVQLPINAYGIGGEDVNGYSLALVLGSACRSIVNDSLSAFGNYGSKVAAHELGHSFGLVHNTNPETLMWSSNSPVPGNLVYNFPFCYLLDADKDIVRRNPFFF